MDHFVLEADEVLWFRGYGSVATNPWKFRIMALVGHAIEMEQLNEVVRNLCCATEGGALVVYSARYRWVPRSTLYSGSGIPDC
mmetsp:Transcript_24566/g.60933  ORF Transcript_24566/g.60933 Transcript_24566/m.60933 type:complete len:83 (-) Transcript_24566:416-664(-)